jgi:hypothetical protein
MLQMKAVTMTLGLLTAVCAFIQYEFAKATWQEAGTCDVLLAEFAASIAS